MGRKGLTTKSTKGTKNRPGYEGNEGPLGRKGLTTKSTKRTKDQPGDEGSEGLSGMADERLISGFARTAIVFAVLLAIGEAVRNWGDWQWWPFWLVDYIAAALLFVGGRWALKNPGERRISPLVGAFGFSASLGYISFFGHLSDIGGGTNGPIPHVALTAIIGVLFALALGAFLWLMAVAIRAERS